MYGNEETGEKLEQKKVVSTSWFFSNSISGVAFCGLFIILTEILVSYYVSHVVVSEVHSKWRAEDFREEIRKVMEEYEASTSSNVKTSNREKRAATLFRRKIGGYNSIIINGIPLENYCQNMNAQCAKMFQGDNFGPPMVGPPGPIGMQGAPGLPGRPGPPGLPGLVGRLGGPGPQGKPGKSGMDGIPGMPGLPGSKGDKGALGLSGYPGIPGIPGEKGIMGEPGTPGPEGIPGIPGLKGDKGQRGFPGPEGIPGESGFKGDKGEIGYPGPEGIPGMPGLPGFKGERGVDGFPGMDGLPGLDGKKGEAGNPGSPGLNGDIGVAGMPGILGPPGLPGEKGESGKPGLPGFKGDKGNQGNPGIEGLPGLPGEPGKPGLDGIPGDKGDIGHIGLAGFPGEPGMPGRIGPKGDKGDPGPRGIPGEKGGRGPAGPVGPPGIIDRKEVKDLNKDGTNGRIKECTIIEIGAPESQVYTNLSSGSWMQDLGSTPIEDEQEKFWVTHDDQSNELFEFDSEKTFRSSIPSKTYHLKRPFGGSRHVIYKNCFFYNERDSSTVVKFNLDDENEKTLNLSIARSKTDNNMDFSVDENGLWVILPSSAPNKLNVFKIDDEAMKIKQTWNINMGNLEYEETFVVCGVLYVTHSDENNNIKVIFAMDLYTDQQLDVYLELISPFENTTMLGYNPIAVALYASADGNQLTYPLQYD